MDDLNNVREHSLWQKTPTAVHIFNLNKLQKHAPWKLILKNMQELPFEIVGEMDLLSLVM